MEHGGVNCCEGMGRRFNVCKTKEEWDRVVETEAVERGMSYETQVRRMNKKYPKEYSWALLMREAEALPFSGPGSVWYYSEYRDSGQGRVEVTLWLYHPVLFRARELGVRRRTLGRYSEILQRRGRIVSEVVPLPRPKSAATLLLME